MKIRIIFLSVLFLGGCAMGTWYRPGATVQDYNKDSYECEKDTRQSGYFGHGVITRSVNMNEFYSKCMVSKGWTLQTASQGRTGGTGDNQIVNKETTIVQGQPEIQERQLGMNEVKTRSLKQQ